MMKIKDKRLEFTLIKNDDPKTWLKQLEITR